MATTTSMDGVCPFIIGVELVRAWSVCPFFAMSLRPPVRA